jgi:ribonuclease P protein subunit RPR2
MAKKKAGIPNRQSHARIAFLYQAANYFASLGINHSDSTKILDYTVKDIKDDVHNPKTPNEPLGDQGHSDKTLSKAFPRSASENLVQHPFPMSALLTSQIQTISHKAQVKVSRTIKRSICKRCRVVLREGLTSATSLENHSRGGTKPWADVLLVTCLACGMEKRFPLGYKKPQAAKANIAEDECK